MRPIPDRLTPLECWPVHMTRQETAYCDRSFLLVVGHRTIGRTRGRAITTIGEDRWQDPSWGVTNSRNISTLYNVSEQSIGGTTDRKVARPVLNMTIDLVATDLPLAITHDLCDQSYDTCDQSYVLATSGPRFQHVSVVGRS